VSSLLLLGLVLAAGYAFSCVFWPNRLCPACEGSGRLVHPTASIARPCRRCRGGGTYPRLGRRVFDAWRRHRRNHRNRY
jgi:hypothetical protein